MTSPEQPTQPATATPWRFPTLAAFLGIDPGVRMPCPVCGSSRTAGEILDFRQVPSGFRPKYRRGEQDPAQFACDGCREAVERNDPTAAEVIAQSVGAPQSVVAKLHARRGARDAALSAGNPAGLAQRNARAGR